MVNIVVCTFVFGLGDDYCIFTSSGILARYRSGSDDGPTIRASVILSAITTIIGTGVLILAEHPALRSIAFLSVTGMLSILFISLTVQPLLYRWMITGRAAKGKFPSRCARCSSRSSPSSTSSLVVWSNWFSCLSSTSCQWPRRRSAVCSAAR